MPTPGSPPFTGTSQFASDSGMPPFALANEFELYDADDVHHTAGGSLFDFAGGELIDPTVFAESKPFSSGPIPSTRTNLNRAAPDCHQLPSHRGSSSSSSSRESANSNSAKTSNTSADVMMTDEHVPAWHFENVMRHETSFMFDSTDAATMDMSNVFDFESASSSPSPPTNGPIQESNAAGQLMSNGPVAKRIKGHHKGQSQHSLTKSMNGLKTSGSREGSPMSNLVTSQEASPIAMFHSPPSDVTTGHFNGSMANVNMNSVWPMSGLQATGPAPQVRQDSMGIPAVPHGLPSYSPQMNLTQALTPRLVIQPTPLKSRVETQIPIKLTIHNLPQGIKRIHLPTHTISKPKLLAKPPAVRSPDMLEAYTMLVCTSAMQDPEKLQRALRRAAAARHDFLGQRRSGDGMEDDEQKPQNGGEVRICSGCITRERKRAGRKKHKKPEEEELWNRYENERAIVFNTNEIKEWQVVTPSMIDPTGTGPADLSVPAGTVQVDAPMRIACYCRHHGEKMGFQVIFTIKDYKDNVICQQISSSIMITDDHKAHVPQATTTQVPNAPMPAIEPPSMNDIKPIEAQAIFHSSQTTSDIQGMPPNGTYPFPSVPVNNSNNSQGTSIAATPRNLSRQGSPTSPSAPLPKKRKASGSVKLPSGLAMTRLETGQSPPAVSSGAQNESAVTSAATSPFSPNMATFPMATDSLFSHGQQPHLNNMGQAFPTGPPTPNSNSAELIYPSGNRNISLDNMQMAQMFSAPTSAHPSRAPSPNRLRNEMQNMSHAPLGQNLYNTPTAMSSNRAPQPMIYKIIPGEGPKSGGVEVTILGSGFTNGGLEVMFGEQRAATTTYWGETSLVCLLPPSPNAGIVPVSIRQPGVTPQHLFGGNQQPLFRYVDDDEHRLIRTALTVLGNKLGGKMTDVADIARNIIFGGPGNGGSWGPSPSGSQTPNTNFSNLEQDFSESVEVGLLRVLELIDLDDSPNKARINLKRSSGQTMLHLACSLGLARFVAGLLSRGANVGIRDKGGFTPLHLAAMNGYSDIVRRLILKGADPNMRSLSGLTPADIARSSDVLRVLRHIENHSRSRSNGSINSRVNSASSLRSLWEPPSITPAHREEFMSDDSGSVDDSSSGDSSSEKDTDEENDDWLDMRRPGIPPQRPRQDVSHHQSLDEDVPPASPSAAMTALRDQFSAQLHQWQNSMTMHFQNLPHMQMPQMPTLPPIPVLPDYHAYLYSAPVMQRITSLVPNIRGPRPGSAGEQPPRDADSKWWDIPFFGTRESPPPRYEDIFPREAFDTKQATAAAAVAEHEADSKYEALYDQETAEMSRSQEVPELLEIGRQRNITKEQQEHLQRAHAQRLKTGSSDKMLWFVWIPILIFILGAMLASVAPSLASGTVTLVKTSTALITNPRDTAQKFISNVLAPV
ncbi:uncharacterized protein GGS25DRAFT_175615 [Hypoxylon fragiforme]|uniref:uncharacterized protein n=1 Tax=Hypoxylon fragiforme TaxID=63214 RepID=UPI0020C5D0E7|nr:uncharacterized protein GGS25DRAFT_175615 [Hypoxylon fragiforme]KAI2610963.1 hypothetical protein GGS25DRAFT_175615 [Hypoxylon fragiforme]